MVVVSTLVTGPTLPWAATRLGVREQEPTRALDVEAAPLERIAADLLQVTITSRSRLHGVEVGELRLPVGASVSLVVRDGKPLVPERATVLRHRDDLLVVTPRRVREATEARLHAVSDRGRLAQWNEPG
jgi:cell volume regulation protein A